MKTCSKCKIEKLLCEFHNDKSRKDGLSYVCKSCFRLSSKIYKENNKDKISKSAAHYHEKNRNLINQKKAIYYKNNKEKLKIKKKKYSEENKEKIKMRGVSYRKANKEKIKKYLKIYNAKPEVKARKKAYYSNLRKTNSKFALIRAMRDSLKGVFDSAGINKNAPTEELFGCTYEEFKNYIESQFTDGMNWGNRGLKGWCLDHIKPISLFDLNDEEEIKKCCHYTNLQPLWATTEIAITYGEDSSYIGNIEKKNKMIKGGRQNI
jgi:hypothetical protein